MSQRVRPPCSGFLCSVVLLPQVPFHSGLVFFCQCLSPSTSQLLPSTVVVILPPLRGKWWNSTRLTRRIWRVSVREIPRRKLISLTTSRNYSSSSFAHAISGQK